MKRHLIAGRFGTSDRSDVPHDTSEQRTYVQLIKGKETLDHGMQDALVHLQHIGVFPSEIGVDLLILAAHVHAADTRISREQESQDSWTREIRVVVPVSDATRWRSVAGILTVMLDFLTGDRWTIEFRERPPRFATLQPEVAQTFLELPYDSVSLFSGGLDSLIGVIDMLHQGHAPLLVSHYGDGPTSKAQNTLMDGLKKKYPDGNIQRLRMGMTFANGLVRGVRSEKSTRGRSFLFFALGIFAGTGLKRKFILRVPENGLIALNVPLDPLRLGSNSTRTTHPFYIARWNELIRALGIDGTVVNPYCHMTKGEMAERCLDQMLLRKLAPESMSCSSPAKGRFKGNGIQHCGYCLPCLIRRAALQKAWGTDGDATLYDLKKLEGKALDTLTARGVQVRSFQYAIQRMAENPQLAKFVIHKSGSLADEKPNIDALADVYRRGLLEVAGLIGGAKTRPKK